MPTILAMNVYKSYDLFAYDQSDYIWWVWERMIPVVYWSAKLDNQWHTISVRYPVLKNKFQHEVLISTCASSDGCACRKMCIKTSRATPKKYECHYDFSWLKEYNTVSSEVFNIWWQRHEYYSQIPKLITLITIKHIAFHLPYTTVWKILAHPFAPIKPTFNYAVTVWMNAWSVVCGNDLEGLGGIALFV